MEKRILAIFMLILLGGYCFQLSAQVRITGPECVVPGTEYQYDLDSSFAKNDNISLCVEGGVLSADKNPCYKGKVVNSVRVTWNDNITVGKISITGNTGTVSFSVRATRPLQGGKIDSLTKVKTVQLTSIPSAISCTGAGGGNCSPKYQYQWEQSDDNLHWIEIKGATSQNLTFNNSLGRTIFLRRRILEIGSNTIAYSNVAVIVVTSQPGTN